MRSPCSAARRCLITADGFYEWERDGKRKQPWFIAAKAGLLAFAGLWERWRVREGVRITKALADARPGDAVEICTILMTVAKAVLAPIHGRMPVILPRVASGPSATAPTRLRTPPSRPHSPKT